MKILTWNINGIRTRLSLQEDISLLDADIICFQETKVTRDMLEEPTAIINGYTSYFSFSRKKTGYSGVATYCRDNCTPVSAEEGLSGLLNPSNQLPCPNLAYFHKDELQALDAEGRAVITKHHISVLPQTLQKVVVAPDSYTGVVPCLDETVNSKTSDPSSRHRHPTSAVSSSGSSSPTQVAETPCLPLVRRQLKETGLSQDATRLVISAWRRTTQKQYQSHITEWDIFCNTAEYDPVSAPFYVGVNFRADLANRVGYSAVNTARSILSSLIIMPDGLSFGKHPVVKRLLKGVFECKPSLPRYTEVWDINVVLNYVKCLPDNNGLNLKQLTLELATLLAILTGQRCQTIHSLTLDSLKFSDGQCVLIINELIKQSRPGFHQKPIVLREYKQDSKLCVSQCLKGYLSSTDSLRQNAQRLFVSYQKLYNPVSKDTIADKGHALFRRSGYDRIWSSQYESSIYDGSSPSWSTYFSYTIQSRMV